MSYVPELFILFIQDCFNDNTGFFFDINLHLQKSKMIADNVKVKESLRSPNAMRLCVKSDMPWRVIVSGCLPD